MFDRVELPVKGLSSASAAFHRTVLAPLELDAATSLDPSVELGGPDGDDVEAARPSPGTRSGRLRLARGPVG